MNHIKEMADLEQRIEDAWEADRRNYPTGNLTDEQRKDAIRNARIEFKSAGATRKR